MDWNHRLHFPIEFGAPEFRSILQPYVLRIRLTKMMDEGNALNGLGNDDFSGISIGTR